MPFEDLDKFQVQIYDYLDVDRFGQQQATSFDGVFTLVAFHCVTIIFEIIIVCYCEK